MSDAKTDATTHTGSCHCGKVRFEVTAKLEEVVACNCSICGRAGYLLTFVPAAQFKQLAGEGAQTDYQFGKKHIHHLFCTTCGVRSFSHGAGPDGSEWFAVNVRTLAGVELESLKVKHFDGRHL
jgi:hypothetical protein